MKVSKKTGKVRLDANEVRIGNFFIKCESGSVKMTDLNGVFHHSVARSMPIGIWLENMWARANNGDETAIGSLKVYISAMWSFFSVAPDDEYISDVIRIARESLERHPDWYGIKPGDESSDAQAIEDVKAMKEFEAQMDAFGEAVSKDKSDAD